MDRQQQRERENGMSNDRVAHTYVHYEEEGGRKTGRAAARIGEEEYGTDR